MFTGITTVEEFQAIFAEMLLNKTDKVSKVSDGSVLKGIGYGNAKNAQKINKDVAVLESYLFPDVATDAKLDNYARLNGVTQRFGPRQSSTYVLLVAAPNTTYYRNTHTFRSISGVEFTLDNDMVVVGDLGWTYAKVRSITKGEGVNVEALTINTITPVPNGHQYVINEHRANFGGDIEDDDVFRKRVKTSPDILARGTIGMLEQVFMKINENVLRVYYSGLDTSGKIILSVLTVNGIDLQPDELNDILIRGEKFFTLTEMRPLGFNGFGLKLQNVQWQPIDISMRVELESSFNADDIRKDMQISMNKYIDYRYYTGGKIEWDNLLQIAKSTEGVRYVVDAFFFPNSDVNVDIYKLPRIRGFRMLDVDGNLIQDIQGILNPVYYPNDIDFIYQASVLQNL